MILDNPQGGFDAAEKMAREVAASQKKIDPALKELDAKVPAALAEGDQEMLEYYLKAIRIQLSAISHALERARVGLENLEELEEFETFYAGHLADIERLTKTFSAAQKSLTQQYQDTKALENCAEKGLKTDKGSKEDFFREVARYDNWITGELKNLKESQTTLGKLYDDALDYLDDRDAKRLADVQKQVKELLSDSVLPNLEEREGQLKALLKKIEDRKFDAKTAAELKDAVTDLQGRVGKATPDMKDLIETEAEVLAFKVESIDVKQALKVLKLDAKAEAKLAKVLKGPPSAFEKGLDGLARELKLKTNGKSMLVELRKAEVL